MKNIENEIEKIINPLGLCVVRVIFLKESKKTLQVMIDRLDDSFVTINDCEIVSKEVSPLLDVLGFSNEKYYLEVSSTGLNRPLIKERDFIKFQGKMISIELKNSILIGEVFQKRFKGILSKFSDGVIEIKIDLKLDKINPIFDRKICVPYDEVAKANLIDINNTRKNIFDKKK